jgi:hypothetical protein
VEALHAALAVQPAVERERQPVEMAVPLSKRPAPPGRQQAGREETAVPEESVVRQPEQPEPVELAAEQEQ